MRNVCFMLFLLMGLTACLEDGQNADQFKEYDGPVLETTNVELLYSDSAVIRIRLQGKKQLKYENGDEEFPEGFYIEFFEEDGTKSSTIEANQGAYDKEENLYTATGEVVVKNLLTEEKLETELLNWSPTKHEIFTDRYVEITTEGALLMGEGLKSDEKFVSWQILKPTGSLPIN